MRESGKMDIKSTIQLNINEELYKLVDFLNKNLKDKNLIFGLSQKDDKMTITIYET